ETRFVGQLLFSATVFIPRNSIQKAPRTRPWEVGLWVVQEGFLLCKRDDPASLRSGGTKPPNWKPTISSKTLKELYVVLTMNRKLEFFDGSDIETRSKVDSAYLQGFGGWDGDGLLKVDSYGLELKVERNAKSRMHLAAFNRVDLIFWIN
ncbi:uncharacterized protein PITG_22328, partial [Phytophthora infestans T30-4]